MDKKLEARVAQLEAALMRIELEAIPPQREFEAPDDYRRRHAGETARIKYRWEPANAEASRTSSRESKRRARHASE